MMTTNSSPRSLRALIILMVICGSLLGGAFTSMQDTWIAVLLMGVVYLPCALIYSRICALYGGTDFFQILTELFGRVGGTILTVLTTLYVVLIAGFMLRNFTEFTTVISLNNTPRIPIMILLLLPVLYIAKGGEKMLSRWAMVILCIIALNVLLTILFALDIFDPNHLLPILDHNLSAVTTDAFFLGGIVAGEAMVVMLMGMSRQIKRGRDAYKVFVPGMLLGIGFFAIIILRNVMILGPVLEHQAKFSTYMAVRIIEVGDFFERIESIISFSLILLGVTKMAVFISTASMGAAHLLKVPSHTRLLMPIGLLVLAISALVFKNTFEMYERARGSWIIFIFFQFALPLLVWLVAEVKSRKKRNELATVR